MALASLVLDAALGQWWSDPVAALTIGAFYSAKVEDISSPAAPVRRAGRHDIEAAAGAPAGAAAETPS
jgi:hypothetical protein